MELRVCEESLLDLDVDALVVAVSRELPSEVKILDEKLDGLISDVYSRREIKVEPGCITEIPVRELGARWLILLGLGEERLDGRKLRDIFADLTRRVRSSRIRTLGVDLSAGEGNADALQAVVEGLLLGTYEFTRYKKEKNDNFPCLKEVCLGYIDTGNGRELALERAAANRGEILARATASARDLVNEPANILTPTEWAKRAEQMAGEFGLDCKVYDEEELAELGMGALLGVGRGSAEPPRVIELRYYCGSPDAPTLALVGKGLTFDSGGICLKKSAGMEAMKMDMAGGAAVFAALQAISELKPSEINVVGLIGAVENLPGGRAQKPGDVRTALNGKTIEIVNTDAEGRLVLADLVAYAATNLNADWIVDIATLTGACVVALGDQAAAIISNDDKLTEAVSSSGEAVAERFWRLPSFEEYREQLKSEVADIKNVGGRKAGTITGGLFIGAFCEDKPWVHLDIAGMAWVEKDRGILARGATGFGTRTLALLPFKLK